MDRSTGQHGREEVSKKLPGPWGDKGEEEDESSREMCYLRWWAVRPGGRQPQGWVRPKRRVGEREAGR
jgi:hypothetical protein